jgi:hypothetical protein
MISLKTNKIMENNLDKTNFEITKKLEQIEREKYTKRYNNLNYVDFSNPNADKISSASTTTIKQETTLEQAAERILANNINGLRDALKDDDLFFFYKGVIQCYGEAMAKWQQEQMYSEEDMKKAFHVGRLYLGREGDTNFEQFIEEFKNK